MRARALSITAALLLCALPARAQQSVALQFDGGRVTLRAENAPVRAILAEWARLGGATIVNGDRVAGPPVTLELTGVPERQALDVVLRSVAGYMLAPRPAGSSGASAFDRILLLPTSVAPSNPSPPPTPAVGAARPVLPRPQIIARPRGGNPEVSVEDNVDGNDAVKADPSEPNPEPRLNDPRVARSPFVVRPPTPPGADPLQPVEPGKADQTDPTPAQKGVAPTPANPFGIPFGSSTTPGVVTPAPQPQRPATNRVQ